MPVGRGQEIGARVDNTARVYGMEQHIVDILNKVTAMNKKLDELEVILQRIQLDVSTPTKNSLGETNQSLGAMRLG